MWVARAVPAGRIGAGRAYLKNCGDSEFAYDLSHRAHIYAYIITSYPCNNHVIFKMWLYPHILLCMCVKIIQMQEKKVDISPFIYVVLMIVVFAVSI